MPSANRGQYQNQGRHDGGAGQGARAQEPSMGRQIQEGVGAVGERLQQGYESVRDDMGRRYRRAEGVVARNPAPSVLLGFGIGFGLGLVLTTMLTRPEESWSDWGERQSRDAMGRARDTMRHAHRSMYEAQDTVRHLPDAFHSLAESIRSLPDAIARHLPSALGGR